MVRCLHLSASILLASLFLFEAVIVAPSARKTSPGIGHLPGRMHRLTCRVALWTLLVALMSWFGWSWLVASTMTGDDLIACLQSGDWLTVLTGTQFGHIWLFRVIVSLISGIILWVVARTPGRRSFLQTTLARFGDHRRRQLTSRHATNVVDVFSVQHSSGGVDVVLPRSDHNRRNAVAARQRRMRSARRGNEEPLFHR